MSTAELGKSLAEMIRQDKIHIISCTGANLEEDIMNLVAHNSYKRIPDLRALSAEQETELFDQGLNRVTDTCLPEEEAFRKLEKHLLKVWTRLSKDKERLFPHECLFEALRSKELEPDYEIDPKNSWVLAALQKNTPMVVPGWEDSTTAHIFASYCLRGQFEPSLVKSAIEYMLWLANWYKETSRTDQIEFFQIGGGIAGDFPICVVPMINQDIGDETVPLCLLLPNLRFNHQLWVLLGSDTQ